MSKRIAQHFAKVSQASDNPVSVDQVLKFIRAAYAAHAARMANSKDKVTKTKHRQNFLVWKNFVELGNLTYLGYSVEQTCKYAVDVNSPLQYFR